MAMKQMLYLAANGLYFAGWCIALIGLALSQDWCSERSQAGAEVAVMSLQVSHVGVDVGKDCDKFFRFPWAVWALDTIPALLALGAAFKPGLCRGATTAFFASLVPLNVILADTFINLAGVDAVGTTDNTGERRFKLTLAGFAIMAGMGMLLLLLDSLLVHDTASHKHSEHEHTGGAVGGKDVHHHGDGKAPANVVTVV